MAPTGSRRTTRTRRASKPKTARKVTRTTIVKKPQTTEVVIKPKQNPVPPSPKSSPCLDFEAVDGDVVDSAACSTPKAERFQLPKNVTCPAAPKKPRMKAKTCLFRRAPIAFFAPPDLELFFYYANLEIKCGNEILSGDGVQARSQACAWWGSIPT